MMAKSLSTQLKEKKKVKAVIKEARALKQLEDGRQVEVLLAYVPSHFQEDAHGALFELIKEELLHNFVFSFREIEKKIGIEVDEEKKEEVLRKAVRKLSKKTAKGELGELLLYSLLEAYFDAPKLLSKISLKTSRRMPVFGADAVHGRFRGEDFVLYLGESKLHKKFKSAAKKASESIRATRVNYEAEFDLLDSHMDYPGMTESQRDKLIQFLNPYGREDFSDCIESPCFIGFSQPELFIKDEFAFLKGYSAKAVEYLNDFYRKVERDGGDVEKVILLMLPFECIDKLVEGFIAYFGVEE